ncbi:thioredoxin [Desulfofundulus thermobenzoicus]|uniref:Thioredoxin n=1 Tax=Desulfofundulus thermobenzoicus TaxID=29376 RepID=A0A6N7IQ53_9FIRM|nr:thioredoxin [Desulfofundulus thermobenzoicus]MQL52144.1 thioredoxin [Desulfofundulus thermobenzoicus]HHW43617.1 thioredoxin [Desulfotomaculum sp.]
MALELNENNFETEVLQSSQPVLVDFWAPWCGPCRSMAPIIDELAGEFAGKAKVAKVNVDQNRELASRYGVMSIPTMILFKGGQAVGQVVGYTPKGVLAKKLESLL